MEPEFFHQVLAPLNSILHACKISKSGLNDSEIRDVQLVTFRDVMRRNQDHPLELRPPCLGHLHRDEATVVVTHTRAKNSILYVPKVNTMQYIFSLRVVRTKEYTY